MRGSRTQTLTRARRVIWEGGSEGGDLGDGGDRREGESQGAWCDGRVLEAAISGAEERMGNSSEGGVHLGHFLSPAVRTRGPKKIGPALRVQGRPECREGRRGPVRTESEDVGSLLVAFR